MSELAKAVLCFLQAESDRGKKSFTITDLTIVGSISETRAKQIIDELEVNGYIEVHRKWVSGSFNLI